MNKAVNDLFRISDTKLNVVPCVLVEAKFSGVLDEYHLRQIAIGCGPCQNIIIAADRNDIVHVHVPVTRSSADVVAEEDAVILVVVLPRDSRFRQSPEDRGRIYRKWVVGIVHAS